MTSWSAEALGGVVRARSFCPARRPDLMPDRVDFDSDLNPFASAEGIFAARKNGLILHGPAICLRDHSELLDAVTELDVALLP